MVKLNKIYTRTGDDGTTGLTDGSRVPKHSPRPQAYGSVDELNSSLGMVYFYLNKENSNILHFEIKNLIREAKIHQIPSVMQTAQREGMITMDKSIEDLIGTGVISNAEKNS